MFDRYIDDTHRERQRGDRDERDDRERWQREREKQREIDS